MRIVGVDPGASGALAMLDGDGRILEVEDMPSVTVLVGKSKRARLSAPELARLFREWSPDRVLVEQVGGMPGQGGAASFQFGYAAGGIEGVLAALGIPCAFVTPAVWKRAKKLSADKGSARLLAQRTWPAHSEKFARVRDADRAEAALIASYGLSRG